MENKIEFHEKSPEIPAEVLESLKSEALSGSIDDREFFIGDINYALRICPHLNDDGSINIETAWHKYQETGEWAVYVNGELQEQILRVMIFHEITEIYFRDKLNMEKTLAHNATLPYEEQFKKEIISEAEEKILQELRRSEY